MGPVPSNVKLLSDSCDKLNEIRLAQAALRRLEHRASLHALGRDLFAGLREQGNAPSKFDGFVNENDWTTLCNPMNIGKDLQFECQGGGLGHFECATDIKFQCQHEFFDCGEFECGGGKADGFECDSKIDFNCGFDFECIDNFDCTSDHLFNCTDNHDCVDDFGCSATGDTDCLGIYPYSIPDDGGKDKIPGDFRCGFDLKNGKDAGGGPEAFDCSGTFECTSKDEFDCNGDADFDCGTGDAGDSFSCGKETRFECDTFNNFDCEGEFECKGSGNDKFDCQGADFNCDTDFECETGFECDADFDCEATFGCTSGTAQSPNTGLQTSGVGSAFDCSSAFSRSPEVEEESLGVK